MAYSRACQQHARLVTRTTPPWKFELALALALLVVGLVLVPLTVFWAGTAVAGDYAGEGGLWGLLVSLWRDAGRGQIAAWTLLLTPYLVVQLLRLAGALLRQPRAVNHFTDSEKDQ